VEAQYDLGLQQDVGRVAVCFKDTNASVERKRSCSGVSGDMPHSLNRPSFRKPCVHRPMIPYRQGSASPLLVLGRGRVLSSRVGGRVCPRAGHVRPGRRCGRYAPRMAVSQIDPLRLGVDDVGEVLTLQRAAYVTEAQAYGDLAIPPLTQTLDELRAELADPRTTAWGIRERGRLVASIRVRQTGSATADIGRLAVAPDRQGNGLGTALMLTAEARLQDDVTVIRLFTGEHSHANLRLYQRLGYRETGRAPAGSYNLVHLAKHRAAACE
jgi:ribosomal protein S18 acetylase RimI-like enzyme